MTVENKPKLKMIDPTKDLLHGPANHSMKSPPAKMSKKVIKASIYNQIMMNDPRGIWTRYPKTQNTPEM